MKVVVIGGTGHVGTYLIPRLVAAGHQVVCVSRQQHGPYLDDTAWTQVQHCVIDRDESERMGDFGRRIAELNADAVVDLICFTLDSAKQLVEAIEGRVEHLLHCGTIWVHGASHELPIREDMPRRPIGSYGTDKAQIETYLLQRAQKYGFPSTVIHPGHIVGPGWTPLNPVGNFNPAIFSSLLRGDEVVLPNFGAETLHHVHADDVAQLFERALGCRSQSAGESFHAVSLAAVSLRGYAEAVGEMFGNAASLSFLPWSEWCQLVSKQDADDSWEHLRRSHCCSSAKAQHLVGYQPSYSSLEAIKESLFWLREQEKI